MDDSTRRMETQARSNDQESGVVVHVLGYEQHLSEFSTLR